MSHVARKLFTLSEHLSSPPIFSGVRVARSLVFCVEFCIPLFVLLSLFIWSLCCLFFDLQTSDHTFGWLIWFDFWCVTPLSAIFQLYNNDQFQWWKNPEYSERTTDHAQATGELYHLQLRVECTICFVIYKAGHELTQYWWKACMRC